MHATLPLFVSADFPPLRRARRIAIRDLSGGAPELGLPDMALTPLRRGCMQVLRRRRGNMVR